MGSSIYHISFTINTQKKKIGAEIYFSNDKEMFERFRAHSEEIEQELGVKAEWRTATKDCRILILNDGDAKKAPMLGVHILIGFVILVYAFCLS